MLPLPEPSWSLGKKKKSWMVPLQCHSPGYPLHPPVPSRARPPQPHTGPETCALVQGSHKTQLETPGIGLWSGSVRRAPPGACGGTMTAEPESQAQPAPPSAPRAGPAPSLPLMTARPSRLALAGTAAAGPAQRKPVGGRCGTRTETVGDSADHSGRSTPPPEAEPSRKLSLELSPPRNPLGLAHFRFVPHNTAAGMLAGALLQQRTFPVPVPARSLYRTYFRCVSWLLLRPCT